MICDVNFNNLLLEENLIDILYSISRTNKINILLQNLTNDSTAELYFLISTHSLMNRESDFELCVGGVHPVSGFLGQTLY